MNAINILGVAYNLESLDDYISLLQELWYENVELSKHDEISDLMQELSFYLIKSNILDDDLLWVNKKGLDKFTLSVSKCFVKAKKELEYFNYYDVAVLILKKLKS